MTTLEQLDIEATYYGESLDMNREIIDMSEPKPMTKSEKRREREAYAHCIADQYSRDETKTLIHVVWVDWEDDDDTDIGYAESIYKYNGFYFRAVDLYGPCGCHRCVGKIFNDHNRELAATMTDGELSKLTYHDGQIGYETFDFE